MSAPKTPGAASETDPAAASSIEDPVPPAVHAVIALFANQLANVAFPDLDAAVLLRQADELRSEAQIAVRARESLDAALAAFVTRLAMLTETARRAVAYARIYSEAHPDQRGLATAIAALDEPALGSAPCDAAPGKRRSRAPRRGPERFAPASTAPQPKDPA
jgi:hypothetical protein